MNQIDYFTFFQWESAFNNYICARNFTEYFDGWLVIEKIKRNKSQPFVLSSNEIVQISKMAQHINDDSS